MLKLVFFNKDGELQQPRRTNQYRAFSEADRQYIRDHWQTMNCREIATKLGRTEGSVNSMAHKVLKLQRSAAAAAHLRKKKPARFDAYTDREKQYLRDHWQTKTLPEMAAALGRTNGSVKSMGRKKMGLQKTHESFLAVCKRSVNTGQFQKGNLPTNTVFGEEPVIRVRHNYRSNTDTKYIRTGFRQWQEYQHYIWQQAKGPVPKNMVLTFINGDRLDCRLENLKLITKAENAIRNSGSLRLTDGYVANTLAWRNPELRDELMQHHPDLLELQRAKLKLNRLIKHHETDASTNDDH